MDNDVSGKSRSPGQIRRPLRRGWLRSRWRQTPSQTGPDVARSGGFGFSGSSALVKLPSSGLRIDKARRSPGRFCPAFRTVFCPACRRDAGAVDQGGLSQRLVPAAKSNPYPWLSGVAAVAFRALVAARRTAWEDDLLGRHQRTA